MVSSVTPLAFALTVASLASCAPLETVVSSKTLSFPVNRVPRQASGCTGSTAAYTLNGGDWVANVSLASQNVNLLIDTGSAWLWTLSDFQPPSELSHYQGHNIYNASASPTWQVIPNLNMDALYGDGTYGATGVVGNENTTVGGVSTTFAIGAANHSIGNVLGDGFDGLIGFAFVPPGPTQSGQAPATFMMAVQDQLDQPVFTCEFYDSQPGTLNLGFVDDSKYTGSLTKLAVNNQTESSWLVDGVSLSSGGNNISSTLTSVLFDTGGDAIRLADAPATSAYWAQVDGASQDSNGNWIFPCNASTPDLTYNFPTGPATLPGSVVNNPNAVVDGNGNCEGGVQSQEDVTNAGDAFFLTYFTIFNQAEPSISFAPYAGSGGS